MNSKKVLIAETSSKSERGELDGVATHNVAARLAAGVGALGAVLPQFDPALDVPRGGVLCALPALRGVGAAGRREKSIFRFKRDIMRSTAC